jgi:sugar/nucleoside kinase (ribokinase family)
MDFPFTLDANRQFDVVGFGLNSVDHLVTVPRYPAFNTKTRMTEHRQSPGGQVSSAMVGAQRLGLHASYIGKVGNDYEGKLLIDSLRDEGVDFANVIIVPGARTQSGVIIIEQLSGERTIMNHYDEKTQVQPDEIKPAAITNARILHLDGYDTKAATRAAQIAHDAAMPVTMDLDTVYKDLDELLPQVDCLITSQSLAGELSGVYDEREGLKRLHDRYGCFLVAMTQGARGSLAYVEGEYLATPGFRAPVCKDTTGAGDAFRAGFIYGLAKGLSIAETLRCANGVAALSCRELGARAGLPRENELQEFIGR